MELLDRAFAAAYDRFAPAVERGELGEQRSRLLRGASGHVVDVGAGVGANLPHLGEGVERVTLLEPSPPMARRLRRHVEGSAAPYPITVLEAPGEALPLPDDSVDLVLFTLVLCTVDDVELTLQEAHRILRPNGALGVIEHVRGDGALARVQDAVRPVWSFVARGCDPSRPTRRSLEDAGFDTTELASTSLTGFGPASPAIVGTARPR